jgi:Na+/melibiose symporter-like transporter
MAGPSNSIIQGIYTRDFGLKLSDIAMFIVIARLFDAFTDPFIGYLSDRTRAWMAGRKGWLIIGMCVSLFAIHLLYFPPDNVTPTYFFVAFTLCYLGWTLIEIPHLAWGAEITDSYDDRSRIFSMRMGFVFFGMLIFLAIPLLVAAYQHLTSGVPFAGLSTQYSRETLRVAFWTVAILFPLTIAIAVRFVPQGRSPVLAPKHMDVRALIAMFRDNKPMQFFASVLFLCGLAFGMQVALAYLHLSSYLQLAEQASIIYVVCYPLNILGIPIWLRVARTRGKHVAFAVGTGLSGLLFIVLGFLTPGEWAFAGYFATFALLQLCTAAWLALPQAILSDISDYGTLRSGEDRSATYFSFFVFFNKCFNGLGGAVGFAIAAYFGFDPSLAQHDAASGFGVRLVMGFLPAILVLIAAGFIMRFPLDKRRHDIIRKRLERLAARRAREQATEELRPAKEVIGEIEMRPSATR